MDVSTNIRIELRKSLVSFIVLRYFSSDFALTWLQCHLCVNIFNTLVANSIEIKSRNNNAWLNHWTPSSSQRLRLLLCQWLQLGNSNNNEWKIILTSPSDHMPSWTSNEWNSSKFSFRFYGQLLMFPSNLHWMMHGHTTTENKGNKEKCSDLEPTKREMELDSYAKE